MNRISEHSIPGTGRSVWLLPVAVLGFLWFILINQLRVEWALNPQYSYGWAVPFLCAYLIWLRVKGHRSRTTDYGLRIADQRPPPPAVRISTFGNFSFQFSFVLLAFLYAPVRLVEAANPEWSLVSWGLAFVVIGLTLCVLRLALSSPPWEDAPCPFDGRRRTAGTGEGHQEATNCELSFPLSAFQHFRFSDFIFPICFFLVAVPWPSVVAEPLIQTLTRADARATVELVGWFGIPAMAHGNVIEVGTGTVGIDEACSGIRSFQATMMISLFLGEFYRLSVCRRVALCLSGLALSLIFNLLRMSLLAWVAARKGVAAVASWHDPAGVIILLACFFGLWGIGVWLKNGKQETESRNQKPESHVVWRPAPGVRRLLLVLCVWIVLTEIGVEAWYRIHEMHLPPAKQWTVNWPTNNPTFKEMPLEVSAVKLLKCDESRRAGWEEDGRQWQVIFIKWNPGTAVSLGHSPNICMTGAGHTLITVSSCDWFTVGGLRFPFAVFQVMDAPQPFYIFYCLWNDRLNAPGSGATYLSLCGNRLAPVLAGLRNPGQRSLEVAVSGPDNATAAEFVLQAELNKLIKPDPTLASADTDLPVMPESF